MMIESLTVTGASKPIEISTRIQALAWNSRHAIFAQGMIKDLGREFKACAIQINKMQKDSNGWGSPWKYIVNLEADEQAKIVEKSTSKYNRLIHFGVKNGRLTLTPTKPLRAVVIDENAYLLFPPGKGKQDRVHRMPTPLFQLFYTPL